MDHKGDGPGPCRHVLTRREFFHLGSRLALGAGLSVGSGTLLSGCRRATREVPILKIGYVPITDATPLLIGHALGFFEQEG